MTYTVMKLTPRYHVSTDALLGTVMAVVTTMYNKQKALELADELNGMLEGDDECSYEVRDSNNRRVPAATSPTYDIPY